MPTNDSSAQTKREGERERTSSSQSPLFTILKLDHIFLHSSICFPLRLDGGVQVRGGGLEHFDPCRDLPAHLRGESGQLRGVHVCADEHVTEDVGDQGEREVVFGG